jgi:hypothetical protein
MALQTAVLVLPAAAAGAGIVAACSIARPRVLGGCTGHLLLAPDGGYGRDKGLTVGKEPFVACAQVVPPRFPAGVSQEAILRAATVAHGEDLALPAFTR